LIWRNPILGYVPCSDRNAIAANDIFVDIDTKARSVKAVDVAPGSWDRLGHNVVGDARMGERQSPGDVGYDRSNVQRGRAGDARLACLA
jgi:hypothetical protein